LGSGVDSVSTGTGLIQYNKQQEAQDEVGLHIGSTNLQHLGLLG